MSETANATNDTSINNENAPNGVLGLLVFVVLTIIYFYIKITSKSPQTIKVWTFIYFLAVIAGEYAINVSNSNVLCGKPQYVTAIYITLANSITCKKTRPTTTFSRNFIADHN